MRVRRTRQVIATAGALASFSVALLAGAAANNEPTQVLLTGIIAMFGGYLVGMALGAVGARVVAEHLDQYVQSNPAPAIEGPGGEVVHSSGSDVESS